MNGIGELELTVVYNVYFRKFKVAVDALNIIFLNFKKFHVIILITIQ